MTRPHMQAAALHTLTPLIRHQAATLRRAKGPYCAAGPAPNRWPLHDQHFTSSQSTHNLQCNTPQLPACQQGGGAHLLRTNNTAAACCAAAALGSWAPAVGVNNTRWRGLGTELQGCLLSWAGLRHLNPCRPFLAPPGMVSPAQQHKLPFWGGLSSCRLWVLLLCTNSIRNPCFRMLPAFGDRAPQLLKIRLLRNPWPPGM
jgi:hypothetical protein